MKKVMYAVAVAAIFAAGCSKEPPTRPEAGFNIPQNNLTFNQITVDDQIDMVKYKGNESQPATNNKSANSASGYFTTPGATNVSFSAVRNNGGLHGQIQFKGGFDFHMSTVCLEISGNQAMIGGQITNVKSTLPGTESFIIEGTYIYFLVEDNGEGSNASSDQISGQLYYSLAAGGPLCAVLAPNAGNWNPAWMTPVGSGGNIQVN